MSEPQLNRAPVSPKHNTSQALSAILQANLDYFLGWQPYAYEGTNIRGVHQTRVSFRRSRSALTVFRKALPRDVALPIANELRWIAGEMGDARDTDVFISEGIPDVSAELNDKDGEARLLALAEKQQAAAYEKVRAMFDSDRYKNFLKTYQAWITKEAWLKDKAMAGPAKKQMKKPVKQFADKTLARFFNKILAQGEHMATMSEEELHELRKDCKKMRYATEFFTPLYNEADVDEFTLKFKGVQKLLGLINDVAVMPMLLDRMMAGSDDAQARAYADRLAESRRSQQAGAKEALMGQAWGEMVAAKRPWEK